MNTPEILVQIEKAIETVQIANIKSLPIDRWIASSVLQKSIRRNSLETAQRAAATLWHQDKRSFWNRIAIIACEDIGVSSSDIITIVLTAVNNTVWRKRMGDLKVGLYLTMLLCTALKVRLADEMYSIVDRSSDHAVLRQNLALENNQTLADIVLNDRTALSERCLALWFLIGTKRYPSDNLTLRNGSFDLVVDVLRSLETGHDLTEACVGSLKRSQYPLALWTPLLSTEFQRYPCNLITWNDHYKPSSTINGIPLVALDGFTRLGKTSFRTLRDMVPALQRFTTQQIALGIFYIEGWCIDSRLTCIRLDEYRNYGEIADFQAAGLDTIQYIELKNILSSNHDLLESIRKQELKNYLHAADEQFNLKNSHE